MSNNSSLTKGQESLSVTYQSHNYIVWGDVSLRCASPWQLQHPASVMAWERGREREEEQVTGRSVTGWEGMVDGAIGCSCVLGSVPPPEVAQIQEDPLKLLCSFLG